VIVVTGGSGVIGRALMSRLRAERLPCIAVGRDLLTQPGTLVAALSQRPSVIVHLAAVVPQPPTILDNKINADRTRTIDKIVLGAVGVWRCHVLYASGCSLYTKVGLQPRLENEALSVLTPASAYLDAKLQGEREYLASGLATILRIAAPIGEGLPVSTVLGRFIQIAKSGGKLEVWGRGQREQNYVDVADIADAILRALIIRPIEIINIAADRPVTMLDLAKKIVRVCGSGEVDIANKPDPRDGEPARYSNEKAAELLGWRPVTSIDSSLERLS
jgi:nucleoside-diphosphate-sugar epimerase